MATKTKSKGQAPENMETRPQRKAKKKAGFPAFTPKADRKPKGKK